MSIVTVGVVPGSVPCGPSSQLRFSGCRLYVVSTAREVMRVSSQDEKGSGLLDEAPALSLCDTSRRTRLVGLLVASLAVAAALGSSRSELVSSGHHLLVVDLAVGSQEAARGDELQQIVDFRLVLTASLQYRTQ